jgi:hypothetical protein
MTEPIEPDHTKSEPSASDSPPRPYTPPTVTVLGTLAELTGGGTNAPTDGVGGAGSTGSVP